MVKLKKRTKAQTKICKTITQKTKEQVKGTAIKTRGWTLVFRKVSRSKSTCDTHVTLVDNYNVICNVLKIYCHDIKCITSVQYQWMSVPLDFTQHIWKKNVICWKCLRCRKDSFAGRIYGLLCILQSLIVYIW